MNRLNKHGCFNIGRGMIAALAAIVMTAGTEIVSAQPAGSPASNAVPAQMTPTHTATTNRTTAPQEFRVIEDRPDRQFVRLPNGMLVIVQELHTAPIVTAQVWVKTGSIYEQEHVGAGLSHFLEHLLSGGTTTTRTEAESNAILGAIGAQTNAATGLENVHYYINTTSQHSATAIDLLSDWMMNSVIRQEEYAREREVIQREFEHGQGSPDRIFWKLTQQARFEVHPARHPTIGYLDEFLNVSRDEIHAFYKKMYVPNNMVFVVVGDVKKDAVVAQITELWKNAQAGALPEVSLPVEPQVDQPRELVGEAAIDQPKLRIAWPGTKLAQEHDYALDLLANVLGEGESSRLARSVRDTLRVVNSIDAYNLSFAWGQGFFGIDSTVTIAPPKDAAELTDPSLTAARIKDAMQKAKAAILAQVHEVIQNGVTDEELLRAKRQQMASSVYRSQTAQSLASRIAGDLIGMGDPDYQERYVKAIEAITPQDIQAAAKAILRDERLMTISLLPQTSKDNNTALKRPADPDVKFKSDRVELDNTAILARYENARHTSTQQQRAAIEIMPMEQHVLANGMRVLIQRSTLVPAVAIQMYQLGGLLGEQSGQEGVANAVSTMLTRGTRTRNAQEIANQIENLGAGVSPGVGNNTFYTRSLALKDDWKTVLDLMADVTLNPSFPQDEWEKMQPRLLAAIDRQNDSWASELRTRFRVAYFGDAYPWSQNVTGRRDVVAKLTSEDLAKFYFDRLDASQTVIAIIGDVQPAQVLAQVTRLFEKMPGLAVVPFEAKLAAAPVPGVYEYHTNKPMVAVQMGYGPGPDRKSTDYAAISVLSKVLSDFPTGWLEQELRGKGPGLVYAVGAGQFTGVVPGYLAVLFNTQPSTAVEALTRTASVFQRARDTVIDQPTLARAKAAVLTEEFMYKQTNGDRATEAALNELYGLGTDAAEQFQAQINTLTAEALQIVAQTYLREPVAVIISHQPLADQDMLDAVKAASVVDLKVIASENMQAEKMEKVPAAAE